MSIQLCAYMSYDGDCADAMKFYAQVLGAKLEALITYGDMPGEMPVPAEHANRVMHAYLVHSDFALMAGDAPPGVPFAGIQGCMLAITYPAVAEATRVFNALADGGKVTMPLAETFWADTFGMVTDRFGTPWGVNGGPREMAQK
ncbi:3-demethylubiquinone-9 3-methyltransferase [Hydrogenophaga sp. Root209]|uniref:VOC family protein n=1 Tax=unclassified Hydrogenophaga TaxID=2610897 RepID=UPI0006FD7010|nr:VOC family protein [Hydrogenophaga sp. Root209]KRC04219.1 3-demethylubiquinone-9 3-methyltransferase [Hydrogenophaga sp. Root209]